MSSIGFLTLVVLHPVLPMFVLFGYGHVSSLLQNLDVEFGALLTSYGSTLLIWYYDYRLMTLSFACFISFQREKRELEIIWDHIYNIIV